MSWQQVKLGDIFEIARGGSPRPIDQYITDDPNGLNWISIKDASNSSKYIYKTEKKIKPEGLHKTRLVHPDDFLLTNSMSFGRPYIMKTTGCIHDGWLVLSADKTRVDTDYFYHLLGSDFMYRKFTGLAAGAVVKNLNTELVKSVSVPLPPLAEQRRIASILDQADELRQKRQQAIEKLDQLLQATFIDMFGDPVSNTKGWEVKKLSELSTKIHSGNTPKGGSENYVDQGIIFLRSQNVWKNKVILDDVAYIDAQTHAKMMKSSVKHEDLLMTKTGRINTQNSSLGRAAIYLGEDDSANINGHVYLIRIKDGFNKFFILRILTLPDYYEYIRSVCVGGIDKRQLNKEHIENFPIIQPPMELQNKFSDIVQVIESQKPKLLEQLELAEDLFNTLQQKAFNGTL